MSTLTVDLPAALGRGQEATTLTFAQISLRGVIVFMAMLAIIRCGDRRFLSQKTASRNCPIGSDRRLTVIHRLGIAVA